MSINNLPIGYTATSGNDKSFIRDEIKGYVNFANPFTGLSLYV